MVVLESLDKKEQYVFSILLGLVSITSMISSQLNVIIIGGFILYGMKLIYFDSNKILLKRIFSNNFLIFSLLIFALHIIGLLYSTDVNSGLKTIETRFSILLWPLILSFFYITRKNIEITFKVFILFTISISIVSHIDTFIRFINTPSHHNDILNFYFSHWYIHNGLVQLVNFEPQYFGLYLVLSNVFLLHFLFNSNDILIKRILIAVLIYQSLFIFQLSARNAILSNFVLILFSLFYLPSKTRTRLTVIVLVIGGISVMGFIMRGPTSRLVSRFEQIFESKETRISRWESTLKIVQRNILWGTGTGSSEKKLVEQYNKDNLTYSATEKYNTHNQYLDFLLKFGLLGFIIFLFYLYYLLKTAIRNKDFVYVGILIVVLLSFITENIFTRQIGIVPVLLFISLIHYSSEDHLINNIINETNNPEP